MDPSKMKAQMANITSIEKEPEVYDNLMKVVSELSSACWTNSKKDKIVKAFSGPVLKQPGEDVITQGDISGLSTY